MPSIVQHIKGWWKARQKEINRRQFNDGFCWVMVAYFIEHYNKEYIENWIEGSMDFGRNNAFDDGALEGLKVIEEWERRSYYTTRTTRVDTDGVDNEDLQDM